MKTQCHKKAGCTIAISQATLVEAVTALCRRAREPNPAHRITPEERNKLIALFRKNAVKRYSITTVTTDLYKNAGNLCRIYELRSYDAVQLACALVVRKELIDLGHSAPIFISADNKLLAIATFEGFAVDNPNNHP